MNAVFNFYLTPNGKTLICLYPKRSKLIQELLAAKICMVMGEPELAGFKPDEEGNENYWLLFPHQNVPEDIRDIAELDTLETELALGDIK